MKCPIRSDIPVRRPFARYGIGLEEFRRRLKAAGPVDCVMITSVMSYWYPGVQWVVEEIRKQLPGIPMVLGGIYATLWPEHARRTSGADLICQGPIEAYSDGLADFLGLERVPEAQEKSWYHLNGILDDVGYWAVRTATGCPFACSYCASGIVSGPFAPRNPEEVIREIAWLYSRGIGQIAFYDDALLVDFEHRLKPVLLGLRKLGIRVVFHTPNGLHARLVTPEAARLLTETGFRSIRLSLETVNPVRQKDTGGKVTSRDLEYAVGNLLDAGMPRSAMGVYLLVGLPGQGLDEIEEGVRYVKSLGLRPYLAEFSPIPGTVEWKRLEQAGLVSETMDPLLTNNSLFYRLFSGYDYARFKKLKRIAAA